MPSAKNASQDIRLVLDRNHFMLKRAFRRKVEQSDLIDVDESFANLIERCQQRSAKASSESGTLWDFRNVEFSQR
ncbi:MULTISPECIES: hypothetical protein [unclassified Bradyrhizobium]